MVAVTPEILKKAYVLAQRDPVVAQWLAAREEGQGYLTFRPRPDDPDNFDEQHSFVHNRDDMAFLVGGNAAGTTTCAMYKLANFVLRQQPPPRRNTPFWVISNSYPTTCGVCWGEKLWGMGFIPPQEIANISWIDKGMNWPRAVVLKPWPKAKGGQSNRNWVLEFRSYEQGRKAMQARAIGGFCFSEQFPWEIFQEVFRGTRENLFPGGQFAEFTPIDPVLSLDIEKIMDDPPPNWRFYRCNTKANLPYLAGGERWFEQFMASVPDELKETRTTGALAVFEGVIYPAFDRRIHVIDPAECVPLFDGTQVHVLATDWGSSEEHAQVTLWGYYDFQGNWTIYDEYWTVDQKKIITDHSREVLDRSKEWGWPVVEEKQGSTPKRRIAIEQKRFCHPNHADSESPGNIRVFNAEGIPTIPVKKGPDSVLQGIYEVKRLLHVNSITGQPMLRISAKCVHLIEEMRKYRWRRGRRATEGTVLNPAAATPQPLKRDDNAVDTLRYMVIGERKYEGWEPPKSSEPVYNAAERHAVQIHKIATSATAARSAVQLAK